MTKIRKKKKKRQSKREAVHKTVRTQYSFVLLWLRWLILRKYFVLLLLFAPVKSCRGLNE